MRRFLPAIGLALLVLGVLAIPDRVATAVDGLSIVDTPRRSALSLGDTDERPSLQFTMSLPLVANSLPLTGIITGTVQDASGPVSDATVRVQTTTNATVTDEDGRFILTELTAGAPVTLTAWAPGYYIAGGEAYLSSTGGAELTLVAHATEDNPDYEWLPSQHHLGQGEDQGCAECHSNEGTALSFPLPVDEWLDDAHSQSAVSSRFLTVYNGTDVHGHQSPLTRHTCSPDYGCFPLPPNPTQPYYGPGYKLDFPETNGNCAACHTPAAAVNAPYGVDPNTVEGVGAEGVACDFCHKVWDVRLDPGSGLPYENMPGVLSFEFLRPPEGHQLFAGPYDDVAPGEDTYLPLQTESQFCAPCHFSAFWDTVIYNSFGEWLESQYSDPETGQTCQDCHMPPQGVTHFARLDRGGLEREPLTIFSHRMPGAADEELLQDAVTMTARAWLEEDNVIVQVEITNDQTGHHVPTDNPMRHLILLVEAIDGRGQVLPQRDGPTVPEWGGVGDPGEGYYGGLPGKAFAKILEDRWTRVSPTVAYWNPTRVLSDNRLAAYATDISTYTFAAPEESAVTIEVVLLFRRSFIALMDQKDWDVPDIVMEQVQLTPSGQPWQSIFLPLVMQE